MYLLIPQSNIKYKMKSKPKILIHEESNANTEGVASNMYT